MRNVYRINCVSMCIDFFFGQLKYKTVICNKIVSVRNTDTNLLLKVLLKLKALDSVCANINNNIFC